jgi:hypothetical protein
MLGGFLSKIHGNSEGNHLGGVASRVRKYFPQETGFESRFWQFSSGKLL